jgi:4-hydroxy-tetrahydrodipicolinate synthase
MALSHFKMIADATDLPFIIFQYPYTDGYAYPLDTLLQIAAEVPNFVAIKDGCYNAMMHERHINVLQNNARPINVLSTHSPWLMGSLTMGCKGLLSGSGSIIADLHVALWQAVQNQDLAQAQEINARIYPTAQCFYGEPSGDMHNRMKEALVMLGRLPKAVVRPPLAKLSDAELANIKAAIDAAGLTRLNSSPVPHQDWITNGCNRPRYHHRCWPWYRHRPGPAFFGRRPPGRSGCPKIGFHQTTCR